MKKIIASLLSLSFAFTCGFIPQVKAQSVDNTIYVSPMGNDNDDGSFAKPLKTIEKAKTLAVKMAQNADSDVNVVIRGGRYDVGAGIEFKTQDSGTDKARINFKAYDGEEVLITNTILLDNTKFSVVTDKETLNRIPAEARGKVYSVNLNSLGVKDLGAVSRAGMQYIKNEDSRMLIVDGKKFTIARWPNNGYVNNVNTFTVTQGHKFSYAENKGNQWATATEAWVYGFFYHLYVI